MQLWTNCD